MFSDSSANADGGFRVVEMLHGDYLRAQLRNQRNDEADQAQSLGECRCKNEDGEGTALDLRLTSHSARSTECCKTNCETGTDNAETISDNSHDSSFVVRVCAG